jgi:hypothetical protein
MDATPAKQRSEKRRRPAGVPLRKVVHLASAGNITVPLIFAAGAILFGLAGWGAAKFDGSFKSVSEIVIRVIASFIPAPAAVAEGNWASRLGAIFGALTTVTSAILIGLAALGEQFTQLAARYLWSDHTIVVGDTPLGRRVAEGFEAAGTRVLHVVPREAPKILETGPIRARVGLDARVILAAAAPWRAWHMVLDLGADAATLALGKTLLAAFDAPAPARSLPERLLRRPVPKRPDTLALCVTDPILTDQFSEVIDAERRAQDTYHNAVPLRLTIFDENSAIARHTLARDPLFTLATERGQTRVHAVIIGFGDLGEKLLDQIMLTGIAGALKAPRITVLDRKANERAHEFRARRPAVLDTLDISVMALDVGHDPVEGEHVSAPAAKIRELEQQEAITAIFLALPSDAAVLRAGLLLRRARERSGLFDAPIFYRWRTDGASTPVLGTRDDRSARSGDFILMDAPTPALLREIADPDGRDACARALHEAFLRGKSPSERTAQAWERLPDTLRRANIRAADHLPAKLWSLGLDIDGLEPGAIPVLDDAAHQRLAQVRGGRNAEEMRALARLEHERWMIERKLDGWRYAPARDDARHLHPQLVPWEQLQRSADDVRKDVDQVIGALEFVAQRSGGAPNVLGRRG